MAEQIAEQMADLNGKDGGDFDEPGSKASSSTRESQFEMCGCSVFLRVELEEANGRIGQLTQDLNSADEENDKLRLENMTLRHEHER